MACYTLILCVEDESFVLHTRFDKNRLKVACSMREDVLGQVCLLWLIPVERSIPNSFVSVFYLAHEESFERFRIIAE